MRPRPLLILSVLLACCALPAAARATVRPRVVGGTATSINQVPYQVALVRPGKPAVSSQFCGGSLVQLGTDDATHASYVITAAHCLYDSLFAGRALAPGDLQVLFGRTTLSTDDSAHRRSVAAASFDPSYDPAGSTDDVALLHLSSAITLSASNPSVAAIPLASNTALPPEQLQVSGWGCTLQREDETTSCGRADYPDNVQVTSVPVRDDAACALTYAGAGFAVDAPTMLCAGAFRDDTCQGDSGGPAARLLDEYQPTPWELVGVTSTGIGCGSSTYPGIYQDVTDPGLHAFVTEPAWPTAPVPVTQTRLIGTAAVGQALTCLPGTWSPQPPQFTYVFRRGTTVIRAASAEPSYVVQDADRGAQLTCTATGINQGGYSSNLSPLSATVPGTPAAGTTTDPTPATTPTTAPPPADGGSTLPGVPLKPIADRPLDRTPATLSVSRAVLARGIRLTRGGALVLPLGHPSEDVSGTVAFRTLHRVAGATVAFGTTPRIHQRRGHSAKATIRLSAAKRSLLRRHRALVVRGTLRFADASGNVTTLYVTFTLRPSAR